jgi:nicotinamidase-related amidase
MSSLKVDLFIIDGQKDFMGLDTTTPDGFPEPLVEGSHRASLPVLGAVSDMKRLARLIKRAQGKWNDIIVTLDSHEPIDVAHPAMWVDSKGNHPAPFTLILSKDIENGTWSPISPAWRPRMIAYTKALEANGKYVLIIWPEHCLIGTWGWTLQDDIMAELLDWSRKQVGTVTKVTKGSNMWTEHYGGLQAEVPDPDDSTTQLNTAVITSLQEADIIAIAGEASSHCVMATIQQVVANIGDENLKKIHILKDCMSPVLQSPGTPNFPALASQFLIDMERRGLHVVDSTSFLT